ncbi:hypothetical protein [Caballeronia zhejiangensis]|uniref:hypothetical protein n=1 Tax=Caballeronia zhejiangensis TaxID=871203 RepID=UPI001ABB35EE|nr:hypothetical protein [Caballeronia zhejiangensis]
MFALVMCVLTGGCSLVTQSWNVVFGPTQLHTLSVVVGAHANHDTAVSMDLVLVHDEATYESLTRIKAADWFANRDDWSRQYQQQIAISSWELVPGSNLKVPVRRLTDGAVGFVVFANYPGERPHRVQFKGIGQVTVILKENDMEAIPG